tara:strand:- start:1155 stop:1793 length:639 start_codon:yes stop_codon:yes gene_type:complete
MQSASLRNQRAVGRALGRSASTIREYLVRWSWKDRIGSETVESEAQALYRELYFDKHGIGEIEAVRKNILSPITSVSPLPQGVADAVERSIRESKPDGGTVFSDEMKRRHLMLLDAAIGYVAQGIRDKEIRRTLRDLPLLLQLRSELSDGESGKQTGRMLVESARVSDAKARGEDIVDAMYEDVCELQAVLGAIKSKDKDIDVSGLREVTDV